MTVLVAAGAFILGVIVGRFQALHYRPKRSYPKYDPKKGFTASMGKDQLLHYIQVLDRFFIKSVSEECIVLWFKRSESNVEFMGLTNSRRFEFNREQNSLPSYWYFKCSTDEFVDLVNKFSRSTAYGTLYKIASYFKGSGRLRYFEDGTFMILEMTCA